MVEFNYKSWPKTKKVRLKKEILLIGQMLFMKGRELTLNALKSGIFPLKAKKRVKDDLCEKVKVKEATWLRILTPKQMFQRLTIALAQGKTGNTSESLLNETRKMIHSFYRVNKIAKKVHNNIRNSIKV